MIKTTYVDHPCFKTFVACLIVSLLILSPLAPLASGAPRSSSPLTGAQPVEPAAPMVPNITATKVDSFPDVDGDGKAQPGETITYDVNISNSGTDATNVNFNDTIDANTTLVGGSLKVSPLAFPDTFVAAKDTQLSVSAPGVLTNDTGVPDPTAVAIVGGATTQGGTVTLNTDGSFTYNPAAGFEGTDTFTYTATNGLTPNDTAEVTLTVDAAPSVTATTPTNGATNQAVNTNISITFSEAVDVTGDWFQISCATSGTHNVSDTVVTGGPTTFTINPNDDFAANETCTVTVFAAQVSDQDTNDPPDNMTANFVFSFTTQDTAPTVTETTPANGATNQTTNTNVTVTFSEPVNVGATWFQIVCTASGTRNVADTVVSGGPTVFTINPNVDFAPGESCTVTITAAQVTDQDSNDPPDNMAANFVFSFSMDQAPTVNATTPTNGATQVANNTDVDITFSEPVDVTGNWFQIVCATSGTRNVSDTVVTGGPTTFNIDPNVDFTNGELCTVTVFAAQVSDQDANDPPQNMTANFVFSFTIDQPPTVTVTSPVNSSTDNLKTTNIVVTFSENVNATTSSFTIECPAGSGARGFGISGSGSNVITLDPTLDLPQGTICTVTVIATEISDTDAGDPPNNMAANFVFSFGVKPEAVDDARNATGNIQIQTAGRSNFTVLTNDISGLPITVTASDMTSVRGGNVAVAANGTFSYNPPAGYEGPDSFNYTISNAAGSDVGTVVITVAGMIWFIDDNPASGACTTNNNTCGRLTNPFSTLAAFEAANGNATPINGPDVVAPEAGDHIFIFSGNYTGPLTLEGLQRVIGQGAIASLQTLSGITPATDSDSLPATGGAKPSITTTVTSGQNGINVVANNQLYGLAFSNTDAAAIRSAANVGTLIMSDIVINNTGGGGIILTNGGTATIAGVNTIVTTTGTALNFTNTNIGAVGLTFQSISSNGGSNTGIILDNTGAGGGLTVNGDGTNTSLGGNASGGTIANKSGADGSTSTGIGIYLNNTANVVLRRMTINGTNQNFGIRGFLVNNFTLEYSTVNGTNGTAAGLPPPNGAGEGSVYFGNSTTNGMTGVGTVTNCIFAGGRARNFSVINTAGTLNRLTITGSQFGLNQNFIDAGDSLSMESRNPGTILNATVRGSTFTGAPGDLVEFVAQSGTTMDVIFGGAAAGQPNAMSNNHAQNIVGGGGMTIASAGTLTFNVSNNTMRDANGSAVTMQLAAPLAGSAELRSINGTFNSNTIGVAGVVGSGSATGNGVFFSFADNQTAPKSQAIIAITNNTIRRYNGNAAIFADNTGGNYDVNAIITGNTALEPGAGAFAGLALAAGAPASADDIDVCASILNNNFSAGDPANANDIIVGGGASGASSIRLPGFTPSGSEMARQIQVQNFIQNNNNVAGTVVSAFVDAPATFASTFIGGAACTSPSAMVLPAKSSWRDTFAKKQSTSGSSAEVTASVAETKPAVSAAPTVATVTTTVTKAMNAKPTTVRARQTVSHHAKIAKRNNVATQSTANAKPTVVIAPQVNNNVSKQSINAVQGGRTGKNSVKPRFAPLAGETVTHSVGTLLAGKTVHIQFQVTVNVPYGGGEFVSNQGTVSGDDFTEVLTDDPAVGGANDPTLTPILETPNVSALDAQANEPPSGSTPMLFTIALSAPAPADGASVHYATADLPAGPGHAVAGVDYTAIPDPVPLNFAAGEQLKIVQVNILSDGASPEPDETFVLNLTDAANAVIVGSQAVGTIKQGNAAGTFLISEFRTSGPGGAGDDFVEVYNNSDSPLTVAASDGSEGYGLFKKGVNCSATPILIGTIPNGTVIPARGHYLFVGSAYSLANYGGSGAAAGDQTLSEDIDHDTNIAIFNTSLVTNLSSITRLDAVGFFGNISVGTPCILLSEGATVTPPDNSMLEYSFHRDQCGKKGNPAIFGLCPSGGLPVDTNDNANDFVYSDTSGTATPQGQRLGSPGPENLVNPRLRNNSAITALLIDSNIGAPAPPNRVRNLTPVTNGTNGTLSIRRRFVNNTGAPVTRLRFRIVDISTLMVPSVGIADVRALTSADVMATSTDAGTCTASGEITTPCTVTVLGTTLEVPPTQPFGGGWNSTLSAGTVTLATPLAPGASINLQFLLGVQQTGSFKFFFNVEALP